MRMKREFWNTHDSTEYVNWSKAIVLRTPEEKLKWLKSKGVEIETKSISIRMPAWLIDAIREEANRKDIPYQSFIKMILSERYDNKIQKRR